MKRQFPQLFREKRARGKQEGGGEQSSGPARLKILHLDFAHHSAPSHISAEKGGNSGEVSEGETIELHILLQLMRQNTDTKQKIRAQIFFF